MKLTSESWRRAARTFIQAALSYILVNLAIVDFSAGKEVVKSALIGLAMSALSAGIAAVMNRENPNENENEN